MYEVTNELFNKSELKKKKLYVRSNFCGFLFPISVFIDSIALLRQELWTFLVFSGSGNFDLKIDETF